MGLDRIELVLTIEEEFDIDLPAAVIEKLTTVGDFYDDVYAIIEQTHPALANEDEFKGRLWKRIATLSADLGCRVPPDQVTRQTRFTEDLGYG